MIEAARKRLPDIAFEVADIREWRAERPFDVILANAVLQWIPGHETLAPALIGRLAPGGALAVQTPDNLDEPSHRLMRETAAQGPWAAKLAGAGKARAERHGAEWYFRLLRAHAPHVDVWRTTYYHPLAGGAPAVVEWLKATGLRPFLDPLEGGRARGLSLALRGGHRRGLSGGGGRDRVAALSEAILRREALSLPEERFPIEPTRASSYGAAGNQSRSRGFSAIAALVRS